MPLLPKKEFYTSQDLVAGLCTMDQVGLPVEDAPPTEPVSPTAPDMAEGLAQAYAKMGGDIGFTEWAAKNPGLVYPQMIKMGIAITAKATPPSLPNIDDLTDEDLGTLSTADLKRILLTSVGVTKKSQLGN